MPKPYLDEVKVVEKEVIKEVIKEVPVEKEVVREVIKEVPVEKVVEKIVEKVIYKDKEVEQINETPVEENVDDYLAEEPGYVFEPKEDNSVRKDYDFLDYDPFASVPVTTLNLQTSSLKSKNKLDSSKFVTKTVVEEKAKTTNEHVQTEVITDLSSLNGLENDAFARALVELYPNIKYTQALFYARHRTVGRFYTIGQFKDFLECAYETARTSMEFLTSIGLYRKEQLKNKFVYTPVDFNNEEE
jgi:hypothetical protein